MITFTPIGERYEKICEGIIFMIWLGIDTANTPLSVAIVKDGELLVEENSSMAINHSLTCNACD